MKAKRRNVILAIVLPAIFAGVHAMAEEYRVPKLKWVEVMNPNPIHNMSHEFSFGHDCVISTMGTIEFIGDGLARYHVSGSYGTECPNGTIFEASIEDIKRWTTEYQDAIKAKKQRREAVCKKLGVECN